MNKQSIIYLQEKIEIPSDLEEESVALVYINFPSYLDKLWNQPISENEKDRLEPYLDGYIEYFNSYLLLLEPIIRDVKNKITQNGSIYFHTDNIKSHYIKSLLLDMIFSRENFVNEIIWGHPPKNQETTSNNWPNTHDSILMYSKVPGKHIFNHSEIDRIPYLAPKLVGPKKEELGKLPTDTWLDLHSKNEVLRRIIKASSNRGDVILGLLESSELLGNICKSLGRKFVIIENKSSENELRRLYEKDNHILWKFQKASRIESVSQSYEYIT